MVYYYTNPFFKQVLFFKQVSPYCEGDSSSNEPVFQLVYVRVNLGFPKVGEELSERTVLSPQTHVEIPINPRGGKINFLANTMTNSLCCHAYNESQKCILKFPLSYRSSIVAAF